MIKVLFMYCIKLPSNRQAAGAILVQINKEYRHEGAVKINNKIINANVVLGPNSV